MFLTVLLGDVDNNALDLSVSLQTIFAEFTTDSRLFEASERRLCLEDVVTVDPIVLYTRTKYL